MINLKLITRFTTAFWPPISFYSLSFTPSLALQSFSHKPPPLKYRNHIHSSTLSAALYFTSAFHVYVGNPDFFSSMPYVLCALFTDPQPFVIELELFHQMSENSITRDYGPSLKYVE
jgi:hypothetical protein